MRTASFFFLLWILYPFMLSAQKTDFLTFYEKSGYTKTPRYSETIDYCKQLAKSSPWIKYESYGISPQNRELPLLIADKQGLFTVDEVRKSGKAVMLIQACIHAGESDGKDAGLMLLRDIAILKKHAHLLDNVTILFIPIVSPDGHERFGPYNRINQNGPEEMGWRTTSNNLNLNRDFMKCDAPEMQSWQMLRNKWLPDFFIDCHTTDGADFQYALTYVLETSGNMDAKLTDWAKNIYEPNIKLTMNDSGFPIFPYVQFRNWHDPRSGLQMGVAPPMLSQGYMAVQNRVGLLIETHMLKPYHTRVDATYQMILHSLELLNTHYNELLNLNKQADLNTASNQFRSKPFTLSYTEDLSDSTSIEFLGYDYSSDTSDLTGGLWFKYDTTKPTQWMLTIFPNSIPKVNVVLPAAYIIPPQYTAVIERLALHGVEMFPLKKYINIQTNSYYFKNVKLSSRSTEGRQKAYYDLIDSLVMRDFLPGSMIVPMNQRTARVIAHALEPGSPDSFAAWGFFNICMEQKEYSESYVMETMAREMLEQQPQLKAEFENKKKTDKNFNTPDIMLNWFYSKTPYWDSQFNLYPIARITDIKTLENQGVSLKK